MWSLESAQCSTTSWGARSEPRDCQCYTVISARSSVLADVASAASRMSSSSPLTRLPHAYRQLIRPFSSPSHVGPARPLEAAQWQQSGVYRRKQHQEQAVKPRVFLLHWDFKHNQVQITSLSSGSHGLSQPRHIRWTVIWIIPRGISTGHSIHTGWFANFAAGITVCSSTTVISGAYL